MGRLEDAKFIGLRSKDTNKIIAVYPERAQGSDIEIEKAVKYWHYKQSCSAEEDLLSSFVDVLTENEIKSRNL